MDSDDAKLETARRMIGAWNALDLDRIIELFAEDGRLHSMMEAEPTVGRSALRGRLGALLDGATHLNLDVRNMGIVGGSVVIERVDRFVFRGNEGAVPVVGVLDIEDGHVTEWREYYDRASLLGGMGLVGNASVAS